MGCGATEREGEGGGVRGAREGAGRRATSDERPSAPRPGPIPPAAHPNQLLAFLQALLAPPRPARAPTRPAMDFVKIATVISREAAADMVDCGTLRAAWLPRGGPKGESVALVGDDADIGPFASNFHQFVALFAHKQARALRQTDSTAPPPAKRLACGSPARAPASLQRPEAAAASRWFAPYVAVTVGVPTAWFVSSVSDGTIQPTGQTYPCKNAYFVQADISLAGRPVRIHEVTLECKVEERFNPWGALLRAKFATTRLEAEVHALVTVPKDRQDNADLEQTAVPP